MRFSIWPSPQRSFSEIVELAQHCEATGWDGIYFADHFMPNDAQGAAPLDGPTLECWSVLAGLAVATQRLRIAPLVTSVTYRHPTVLANIAAAVDTMCNGRLLLGLGAGWQENEHQAYGLELGTIKQRLDRFEEAVQVIRSLTRENRTSFKGEYYEVNDAPNQPAPVQEKLPLLIGGSGEKRTLRIAARFADEWNAWSDPALLAHKVSVLRQHCDAVGRDPAEIQVSTQAMLFMSDDEAWLQDKRGMSALVGSPAEITDVIGAYKDAGADEIIIPDFTMGSMPRRKETCDVFMDEVAANFR